MREVYEELLRIEEGAQAAVLVVVTKAAGSTPQVVGAKMLVRADRSFVGTVGGGRFEHEILEEAYQVLEEGVARSVSFKLTTQLGMCCGGTMEAYLEPVRPRQHLSIFGAGHVAAASAALALSVDFRVTVIDDREDWANAERFPGCEVVNEAFEDYLDRAEWGPSDFLFITTHDHALDRQIVEEVLDGPQAWTGMIGSRRKAHKLREALDARGRAPEAIAALRSPVGLDIGAQSPAEIAVSLIAELVRERARGKEKRPKPRLVELRLEEG